MSLNFVQIKKYLGKVEFCILPFLSLFDFRYCVHIKIKIMFSFSDNCEAPL